MSQDRQQIHSEQAAFFELAALDLNMVCLGYVPSLGAYLTICCW
jgi:hypothetical protein